MTIVGEIQARLPACLLPVLALLVLTAPAQGAVIRVTTTADSTAGDGLCSLREAITAANTDAASDACRAGAGNDVIRLRGVTYPLTVARLGDTEDLNANGDLDVASTIRIVTAGSATIDASRISDRVLDVLPAGDLTLQAVEVTGGQAYAPGIGGGIHNAGRLTVVDGDVRSNDGGGIASSGSTVLRRTHVDDNSGQGPSFSLGIDGAGIFSTGELEITGSVISHNEGESAIFTEGRTVVSRSTVASNTGHGIDNRSGSLVVRESTIRDNQSHNAGGGILNAGTLDLSRSLVADNETRAAGRFGAVDASGGGIANLGTATIGDTTITGNIVTGDGCNPGTCAASQGGGIASFGSLTLGQTTVFGNLARGQGGGPSSPATVRGGGLAVVAGTAEIRTSLIAGNVAVSGRDCSATLALLDHSLLGSPGGCSWTGGTGDLIAVEPGLLPLNDNGGLSATLALAAGSPAIDAAGACRGTDQRGVRRPQDGDGDGMARCDIGAFELVTPTG